jgi:hypothetical protein
VLIGCDIVLAQLREQTAGTQRNGSQRSGHGSLNTALPRGTLF